uniref:Uncharacterized protein n=1 Tax=Arundo donax TaxID=35708 RepID=A0A0A8ZRH3_ARUDO
MCMGLRPGWSITAAWLIS